MQERSFRFKFDNEDQKFTMEDIQQGIDELTLKLVLHELNTATMITQFHGGKDTDIVFTDELYKIVNGQCMELIRIVFPTDIIQGFKLIPDSGGFNIDFKIDSSKIH